MMPENYRIGRVLSEVSYAVEPRAIVITMSNQYIICGASRSGKSILARRLQQKFKVSWILGDAIVSSMEDAFPNFGISHHGDLQDIGYRFADYIKFLLWHYGYAGCGYVLDTTHLYPRHIIGMREKIGDVPAVFLGYAQQTQPKSFDKFAASILIGGGHSSFQTLS